MAKRRRRRKVVPPTKTRVNRQASILHAIKCSNDAEWLRQVASVATAREITVQNNLRAENEELTWEDIKTNCKAPNSPVVCTRKLTAGGYGAHAGSVFLVQGIRKIKKQVQLQLADNTLTWANVPLRKLSEAGIVSLAAAPADVREQAEAKLFELGLNEIDGAYGD